MDTKAELTPAQVADLVIGNQDYIDAVLEACETAGCIPNVMALQHERTMAEGAIAATLRKLAQFGYRTGFEPGDAVEPDFTQNPGELYAQAVNALDDLLGDSIELTVHEVLEANGIEVIAEAWGDVVGLVCADEHGSRAFGDSRGWYQVGRYAGRPGTEWVPADDPRAVALVKQREGAAA